MKVLLVNTLYPPNVIGGAEISVQSLAESLAKKGIKIVVATLSQYNDSRRKFRGIKVYDVRLKNVYWPFKSLKNEIYRIIWHTADIYNPLMARQIDRIVQREKPDVIHTNNLSGFSVSIWSVASKCNIPLLHTLRDYYLLCHLSTMYRNGSNCLRQCHRCRLFSFPKRCLSHAPTCVAGISQYIIDRHLSAGFFSAVKDFHVIPNGYRGVMQKKQKPQTDKLRLGYLGRISPEKGVADLLGTLSKNKMLNCDLHIAGTGPLNYVSELQRKYRDRVHFHSYVKPADFFSMIDLLIVPSLWNEPFGRTIIEAFYYGVPVIGSKRGGIPELIDEGKTGYLYDPENADSLINAVEKIVGSSNSILTMQENCLKQSRKFTPETIAENYIEIYVNMLGNDTYCN